MLSKSVHDNLALKRHMGQELSPNPHQSLEVLHSGTPMVALHLNNLPLLIRYKVIISKNSKTICGALYAVFGKQVIL